METDGENDNVNLVATTSREDCEGGGGSLGG